MADVLGRQVCRLISFGRDRQDCFSGAFSGLHNLLSRLTGLINHRGGNRRPAEQDLLSPEIVLHRSVIVQVVSREVRKYSCFDFGSVKAPLFQAD